MRATPFEFRRAGMVVLSYEQPSRAPAATLTPAEIEVVACLARGERAQQIALRRGTSLRTVQNQIRGVYAKFGVCSSAELVARLFEGG